MKRLLTHRSCFYDRVSEKTAENGDRTEKIWTPEDLSLGGAFQVFHLKNAKINKTISIGGIKQ